MINLRRILLITLMAVGGATGVAVAQSEVDTQRPEAPQVTFAGQSGPEQAYVQWTWSRDDVGVVEYRILRNLVELERFDATIGLFEPEAFIEGLPSGNSYFQVQAVDAAGNVSVRSTPVVVEIDNSNIKPPTNVEIINYEAPLRCTTVRFDASEDDRVSSYVVLENLGGGARVDVIPGTSKYEVEYCGQGRGSLRYVQVLARSFSYGDSVRTAPVTVFKHYDYAPKRFDVAVEGSTVTFEWDESPAKNGAVGFVVLDSGQPIVETDVTATGATVDLEPGEHRLQLVTVNEFGNQSKKTAPVIIDIATPAT